MDRHYGEIARSWHHSVFPGHASACFRPARNKKTPQFPAALSYFPDSGESSAQQLSHLRQCRHEPLDLGMRVVERQRSSAGSRDAEVLQQRPRVVRARARFHSVRSGRVARSWASAPSIRNNTTVAFSGASPRFPVGFSHVLDSGESSSKQLTHRGQCGHESLDLGVPSRAGWLGLAQARHRSGTRLRQPSPALRRCDAEQRYDVSAST